MTKPKKEPTPAAPDDGRVMSEKSSTPKRKTTKKPKKEPTPAVRDYDPRRMHDEKSVVEYVSVSVTDSTNDETIGVLVPHLDGRTEEDLKRAALEYVRGIRRVEHAWRERVTKEQIDVYAAGAAEVAAAIVVVNLLDVAHERFGDEIDRFGGEDETVAHFDKVREHYRAAIETVLRNHDDLEEVVASLMREASLGVLHEFEESLDPETLDAEEYDRLFTEAYQARYAPHAERVFTVFTQDIARMYLEHLKPSEATLDEILDLLQARPGFQIATSPISLEIHKSLTRRTLDAHDAEVKLPDNTKTYITVRTEVALPPLLGGGATSEWEQADVLDRIQKSLLEVKRYGAALLKLHLDLTSTAYDHGGELPLFDYDFASALQRQGYQYQSERRGYHPATMRGIQRRLAALQLHTVVAWSEKRGGKEYIKRTPYWSVQAWHEIRQEPLAFDEITSHLLQDRHTVLTGVTIHPGAWWATTRMNQFRIAVPREILALPTDGNGNERERQALQIATYLAVHVRRNQSQNAGGKVPITVGTLLRESGIMTEDAFFALTQANTAKRVRDYLFDNDDQGALEILREARAFDVEIRDVDDYFATGRGWKERFWSTMLDVKVPDLGITKPTLTLRK